MYAITGISGKVGSAAARALLAAGQPVRAVLRNPDKAKRWSDLGCEVAIAEMEDAEALTAAFAGSTAVFILPPSNFDPSPGFPEAQAVIFAVTRALRASTPARVVCLSTIGAQAPQLNLLTQRTLMEQALSTAPCPVTFLRPAWFMENSEWDIARAKDEGVLCSFLQPLDKAVPMVATADVGRVAAELLQQAWTGKRVIELEGPRGCRRLSSPRHSRDYSVGQFAPRRFRARGGPRSSMHRGCAIPCRAYRCWMGSTKVGYGSRGALRQSVAEPSLSVMHFVA